MATRLGLTAACLIIPLTALAPAMAGGQPASGRIVVAEYMRAVPAGTANHCTRVCVKARDMGGKAAPVCVEWKKVC
jgi:hypothetical protein